MNVMNSMKTKTYEEELEERNQKLEELWQNEMAAFRQVVDMLNKVSSNITSYTDLVTALQNPNSSTNKHGDVCYNLVKEKLVIKMEQTKREIQATVNGLNHFINAAKNG